MEIDQAFEKIILTSDEIDRRVKELGKQIARDYRGQSLLVMSVLKGSVFFLADIVRNIDLPLELEFVSVSSYKGGTVPKGRPKFLDALPDIQGKNTLVVEDILDTGETIRYTVDALLGKGATSVKTCVLLAKEGFERSRFPSPDYIGFRIPDEFVVGYGLDYRERYRNLPFVAVLRPEFCMEESDES